MSKAEPCGRAFGNSTSLLAPTVTVEETVFFFSFFL